MKKLRVPSLQHLARNWSDRPDRIAKQLVNLVEHPPTFSYEPVFDLVRDNLVFDLPLEAAIKGIEKHRCSPIAKRNFLELFPMIHAHFAKVKPSFVAEVGGRIYPIGPDLFVPFTPPLIYGVGLGLVFPWLSFWRNNPLAGENLELFVTLVSDLLAEDPDLEQADFQILDFSIPRGSDDRQLTLINTKEINRVSERRKLEMLDTFVTGYRLAQVTLATKSAKVVRSKDDVSSDSLSLDLFPEL